LVNRTSFQVLPPATATPPPPPNPSSPLSFFTFLSGESLETLCGW